MIRIPADALVRLGVAIFTSLGAPREKAQFVSETIVEADLTGHASHGVVSFLTYAKRIKEGYIDVEAEPILVGETSTTAIVDGCWSFGQLTAMRAMEVAVEKAEKSHVVTVTARRCNHIGRVLGTNPLSIAIPTDAEPFILDYATSVVAHGKVRQALLRGERIPLGWIRDQEGEKTDDPAALDAGGWLLPFGGYKGYCLQRMGSSPSP